MFVFTSRATFRVIFAKGVSASFADQQTVLFVTSDPVLASRRPRPILLFLVDGALVVVVIGVLVLGEPDPQRLTAVAGQALCLESGHFRFRVPR